MAFFYYTIEVVFSSLFFRPTTKPTTSLRHPTSSGIFEGGLHSEARWVQIWQGKWTSYEAAN